MGGGGHFYFQHYNWDSIGWVILNVLSHKIIQPQKKVSAGDLSKTKYPAGKDHFLE